MDLNAGGSVLTQNPEFANLNRKENTELRFFCEAFSLIDSMKDTSMLLAFSNLVKTSKDGRIPWAEIPDLYPDDFKGSGTYYATLEKMFECIDQLIRKGWVTPIRIKTLSSLAMEVHEIKRDEALQLQKQRKSATFRPSQEWLELARNLQDLAKYQESHMLIHEDFQKGNYLPHPDSWKVYLGTFSFIFAAMFYAILT